MTALAWLRDGSMLRAAEPTADVVREHATTLRDWYNEPANAKMMGNTVVMTVEDVVSYFAAVPERRARGFLLSVDGALVGDAELRNLDAERGEFSIMIGPRGIQGRGLGSAFAALLHVFAFRELGLSRLYVQPAKENERVIRLELRLGYEKDDSEIARAFADDADAVTMSIGRDVFRARNADAWGSVRVTA